MARRARPYWICRSCSHRNLRAHVNCRGPECSKTRPKKRVAPHKKVLQDMPYDQGWPELSVEIHGGELHHCAVCGKDPSRTKRGDRDHDHRTGWARGVTCSYCNRERLRGIADAAEARLVLAYFERVEKYYEAQRRASDHQTGGSEDE